MIAYAISRAVKAEQARAEVARKAETQPQRKIEPRVAVVSGIPPVDLNGEKKPVVPAATLLDYIYKTYMTWARMPDHEAVILTLWTASTWLHDRNGRFMFPEHPRIIFVADKGSGKTRLMKISRALSKDSTKILKGVITSYGVREMLQKGMTVFLDEYDRKVGRGMGNMPLQELVGAYEADTGSVNARGGLNEVSVFGPMMLAAKPRIITGTNDMLEDLFERSFILTPEKHRDMNDPIPELGDDFENITDNIKIVLEEWSFALTEQLMSESGKPDKAVFRPIHSVPKVLTDRLGDVAKPLLAVADRAVDPAYVAEHGQDLRWALRARDAVQKVLLGRGDSGADIMAKLEAKFGELEMG